MKKLLILGFCLLILMSNFAQQVKINAYPPNWFSQFKLHDIQLILKNENHLFVNPTKITVDNPNIIIKKINYFNNTNYIILDLFIKPETNSGNVVFDINNSQLKTQFVWEIKAKRPKNGIEFAQGVGPEDFIYFLMPDRFSNGNTNNDIIKEYKDQSLNRDSIFLRHGGDLTGIINHLDYLQSLGVTTLWTTPVIENDMPNRTEHGYAMTNHYAIDKRYGGENEYIKLSNELHKRGMKLIMDAVYNHVGLQHFLVQDPPADDWLHQWPNFTQTNFKDQAYFDPYSSKKDLRRLADGWFVPQMPDLNHQNPFVAHYLIQHALWCVETFGIDGWRIDTYIYNDLEFMNTLHEKLVDEYPKITDFGECWVHGTANQAYFCANNLNVPFKSNLLGAADFQTLWYGIQPAVNEEFGWTNGVNKLYNTLSNDFLYQDAFRNVIFLDNHDMTRWYSTVNEDLAKAKMGIKWLLTSRGIPQLYYGTEVLMKGVSNPDGWVRLDFPGGWEGDAKNAFTGQNLSPAEKEMQDLVKKLGTYRLKNSALQTGKLMQFLPKDGVYVYFRYNAEKTIMCVMNTSHNKQNINLADYDELSSNFNSGIEVLSNLKIDKNFSIPAQDFMIIELSR